MNFLLGPLPLQWAALLALAALAGHWAQRFAGLPKIVGYAVVGALAGWIGFTDAAWPLAGIGLLVLELGIAVVLLEAGARLPLRWLRHNPMVLAQSLAESLLTFAAAWLALRALGFGLPQTRALAVIAVAASPTVLMRVAHDLRASGPVADRALALATLNTLYALTLGTAMLRTIDRDGGMLASLATSAAVLLASLLCGAALALLLAAALRVLHPGSQDTAIVALALVVVCAGVTAPLGGSAPLAALLGGLLLRQMHRRPWLWPRQLGAAASILNILMFVLVAYAAAQAEWRPAAVGVALLLIGARLAAKVLGLAGASFGSGMTLAKACWVGVAMAPMSSVALLLTSQFVAASHAVGAQVAAIALPMILVTELLGAGLAMLALYRTGEVARPWRGPRAGGGPTP